MTTKPKSKHPKLSATAEQIRQQLAANNQTLGSVSTYGLPYHELQALTRAENRRRRRERAALTTPSEARRMIYTLAKRRRLLCSLVLTRHKWLEVVEQINPHRFASMSRDSARFQIGRQLARWEACELQERSKTTAAATGSRLCDRLPLFACSGELEANGLRHSPVRDRKSDFWDCGRDGGGQHEIRFRIAGRLPAIACAIVDRLGGPSRNGGHIHLNCKADEETGAAVFYGFRHHLAWFRFLCPSSRRNNRFAGVGLTPRTWDEAKRRKFAAISANNWNRFGTVEVRLWPTSKNAKDWQFRADLMEALARWSISRKPTAETVCDTNRANGQAAWMQFVEFAALYSPRVLRQTLALVKRRARQSRDQNAATECREYIRLFEASGIQVRGYRRS